MQMTAILVSWVVCALALILLAAFLGARVNLAEPGEPAVKPEPSVLGILVDNRGRFSLNRLQLVLWSITVLSLIAGVFFGRWIEGVAAPLEFTIPERVLGLLGIVIGTTVTVGAVKATKKAKSEPGPGSLAAGSRAPSLATYASTNRRPFFSQLFMQEEGSYADDVVDVTKFQSFVVTLILVVAYIALAIHAIVHAKTAAAVKSLPDIKGEFVLLASLSYTGYFLGKLPLHTGSPPGA